MKDLMMTNLAHFYKIIPYSYAAFSNLSFNTETPEDKNRLRGLRKMLKYRNIVKRKLFRIPEKTNK